MEKSSCWSLILKTEISVQANKPNIYKKLVVKINTNKDESKKPIKTKKGVKYIKFIN